MGSVSRRLLLLLTFSLPAASPQPRAAPPAVVGLNASNLVEVREKILAGTLPEQQKPALASLIHSAETALLLKGHGSGGYGCPERGCDCNPYLLPPHCWLPALPARPGLLALGLLTGAAGDAAADNCCSATSCPGRGR